MKHLELYEEFSPANIYEGKPLKISDAVVEWAIRFYNDEVDFPLPKIPIEIFQASKKLAQKYSRSRGTVFGYTAGYIYRGTKKEQDEIKKITKQGFYQTHGISSWTWDYETSRSFSDTLTATKIKGEDPVDDRSRYGIVARIDLSNVNRMISMDVIMDNVSEEQKDRLIRKNKELEDYFYNYYSESELLILESVKIPLKDLEIKVRKHLQ
jgi:hypothetical protein